VDGSGVDAMKTVFLQNEVERLKALRRYQILDTPPEPAFDRIAEMAANFFHVPMAGVSLIDEDRIWFKSRVGISFDQTARDAGLCSSAMLTQGIYHLSDAVHDERALGHSFVTDLGIRFYAAAPLRTQEGFNLGTVWVLDQKERELASGEAEMLRALAALAMNQMELRLHVEEIARLERVQRTIAEGVEAETGDRFLSSLARSLALALEVGYAFVARISEDGTRCKILALWERDHFGSNTELPVKGTPCESVIQGEVVHYPDELGARFPAACLPAGLSARSYCGVHVFDAQGRVFGHVAVLDSKPMPNAQRAIAVMRIFAARMRAEVERLRIEHALREANERLAESEGRFRDFFEEAPLAYVVGSESGIIRANRTAARIFGVPFEEMVGFNWRSLFPDIPEAQRRLRDALKLVESRFEASGAELELRRKEDGRPVWVQWWSKREEGGKYARVMFLDITDRVLMEREKSRLEAENAYLLDEIRTEQSFGDIIGGSSGLRKVMQQVQLVAPTDATVIITGESGTGKELIARAIHERSTRRQRPLIKLNCSAVPEGLFESEFFGHVKGAFTGALKDKPGRFELADGGTLFLDEIGEVPLAMQAKLLRVLQEQELERVGDTSTRKVNVRIIAASNRELKKEVEEGRFRQDLFYRLSVFPIEVPPLRERRADIAPLVAHFIRQSIRRMNRPEPQISKTALDELTSYDWPGNVRELQNAVERAIILWRQGPLTFDLPVHGTRENTDGQLMPATIAALPTRDELKRQEREVIIRALKQTNGRVSGPRGAAELLGMKPSTLASRLATLGINRRTLN
jgi:formate hydrogenlyase transcriptional activator